MSNHPSARSVIRRAAQCMNRHPPTPFSNSTSSLPTVYSPWKWVVLWGPPEMIGVDICRVAGSQWGIPQIMSTYLNANIDEEMKEMNFEHSSESANSKKACCQQIQEITEHHAWG